MKHTAGPWRWVEGKRTSLPSLIGGDGEPILWLGDRATYYPVEGTEPGEEDARLIAAAPRLAEALKEIAESGNDRLSEMARAALREAGIK